MVIQPLQVSTGLIEGNILTNEGDKENKTCIEFYPPKGSEANPHFLKPARMKLYIERI
jgi:hypothetical protein